MANTRDSRIDAMLVNAREQLKDHPQAAARVDDLMASLSSLESGAGFFVLSVESADQMISTLKSLGADPFDLIVVAGIVAARITCESIRLGHFIPAGAVDCVATTLANAVDEEMQARAGGQEETPKQ